MQTNLCACCLLSCWAFLSEFLMPFSPDNILEPTHVAQLVTVLIRTLKTTVTDCAEWLFFISFTPDNELKRCLSTPWRNIGGSRGIAPPVYNLEPRLRWVVNFALQPFYPVERTLSHTWWAIHRTARMPVVWIWKRRQCTHCVRLSCLSL